MDNMMNDDAYFVIYILLIKCINSMYRYKYTIKYCGFLDTK